MPDGPKEPDGPRPDDPDAPAEPDAPALDVPSPRGIRTPRTLRTSPKAWRRLPSRHRANPRPRPSRCRHRRRAASAAPPPAPESPAAPWVPPRQVPRYPAWAPLSRYPRRAPASRSVPLGRSRPELSERGTRLGDPDRFHGHVVAHLRAAPGPLGKLPHRRQMDGIGPGHLGQSHDRALRREQPAVQIPLPGRLAVPGAVGHGGDTQSAAVDQPAQLAGELPDLRIEFIRQGPPTRHCYPLFPPVRAGFSRA